MTDHDSGVPPASPQSAPTPPGEPSEMADAQAAAASLLNRLSAAEQLAVVGAGLVLVVEIVFGVILEDYYPGNLAFLLALAVLAAAYVRHVRHGEVPVGYVTVVRVAGFAILALAVVDVIYDLRNDVLDSGTRVVAGVLNYGGAILMGAGAWMLREE
jgi:hypothetical protein